MKCDVICAQLRARDRQGNVCSEVKSATVEASLEPRWDEEMVLDVDDVHSDSLVELSVCDSRTGRVIGLVGIPVRSIHRNPKNRWTKLQDPDAGSISLNAGVVDAGVMDIAACRFGAVEMEHSLKWKTGQTFRHRIIDALSETLE